MERVCLRGTAPGVAGDSAWHQGPQPLAGPAMPVPLRGASVLGRSAPVIYLSDFSSQLSPSGGTKPCTLAFFLLDCPGRTCESFGV